MATRGVYQLKKLALVFCDWGGSSRGAREFIRQDIAGFARRTPDARVEATVRRNRHPVLIGTYLNGNTKVIGVKNTDAREILNYAMFLRNQSGRKVGVEVASRHDAGRHT